MELFISLQYHLFLLAITTANHQHMLEAAQTRVRQQQLHLHHRLVLLHKHHLMSIDQISISATHIYTSDFSYHLLSFFLSSFLLLFFFSFIVLETCSHFWFFFHRLLLLSSFPCCFSQTFQPWCVSDLSLFSCLYKAKLYIFILDVTCTHIY